jgi:hypothetical protein
VTSPTPTKERVIAKHRFHLLFVVAVVVMRSARHRLANKHKKLIVSYMLPPLNYFADFGPADPQINLGISAQPIPKNKNGCAALCVPINISKSLER